MPTCLRFMWMCFFKDTTFFFYSASNSFFDSIFVDITFFIFLVSGGWTVFITWISLILKLAVNIVELTVFTCTLYTSILDESEQYFSAKCTIVGCPLIPFSLLSAFFIKQAFSHISQRHGFAGISLWYTNCLYLLIKL